MISKEAVKDRLFNDKDELIRILENLGCHHINPHYSGDEIRCALPDGTTVNSVSVRLSPFLPCRVFSRPGYDYFEVQDIFTLVQFVKSCNFYEALDWLCSQLGITNDGVITCTEDLGILKEIRKEKHRLKKAEFSTFRHEILDKKILNQYKRIVVPDWVKEGIDAKIQWKYGIRDDVYNKRWLIPIYDESGNLISIKGRTYAPNWELLGVKKYVYYYKIGVSDILFGYNFNHEEIAKHNEIILPEAEKSVMAADGYGYGWSSSLGTNNITAPLFKKILQVPCGNIVLAFDKDVEWKHALREAKKLTPYKNVWIIYDKNGLLRGKESPMDKGKEIFETLYNERIRVE